MRRWAGTPNPGLHPPHPVAVNVRLTFFFKSNNFYLKAARAVTMIKHLTGSYFPPTNNIHVLMVMEGKPLT